MKLTKPQKLIYDMEKYAGGTISTICGGILYEGDYSEEKIKSAINRIFQINDALRITIHEEQGRVSQTINKYKEQDYESMKFKSRSELDYYVKEYVKVPVNLNENLCNVKIIFVENKFGILIKMHHIIGDAWTLTLIGTQFNEILEGKTPKTFSYSEYLISEEKYINSKQYIRDKDFFFEQFSKCDEMIYLSEKESNSFVSDRKSFIIDDNKTKKVLEYANMNGNSIFTLFMSAIGLYFNRVHMNQKQFCIGTAVLNRKNYKEKHMTGMFVNTVPIFFLLNNEMSVKDNIKLIEDSLLSTLRHQKYNYGELLQDIRKERDNVNQFYDVLLSYQNAKIQGTENKFETFWVHSGMQTETLAIHIDDRDNQGILEVHYDYQIEKLSEEDILTMHNHVMNILMDIITDDSKKIYEVEMMSEDEKKKLLVDFNNTVAEYPQDKCVHELFEEQVEKNPNKIALIFNGEKMTYKELNCKANSLANYLQKIGVQERDIIPIITPRRKEYIVSLLAILKVGAAYVPIDYQYPLERINQILDDIMPKWIITYDFQDINFKKIDLKKAEYENVRKNVCNFVSSKDICYIIYTSGSTGEPKGVKITHRNIVNYCNINEKNIVGYTMSQNKSHTIIAINNFCFDAFVDESLFALLNGWTVVMANEEESVNSRAFANLLSNYPIDTISTTPTKLRMLVDEFVDLSKIRYIILGGEDIRIDYVNSLMNETNARIYNTYGPTETTVGCTAYCLKRNARISIGKPIANTQIYIVDKFMSPQPIGIVGELCIAGDGVGLGYLNRPELTAEKFIDNPFGEGKLYKTGDLAYWREDGNIVYVGRNDFQVKIRGLRIELGEIENAITGINGIQQCVVVVRKNSKGRQLICAFYTGKEMESAEIRKVIGERLPKYMLPHIFKHLELIPLTTSGKVSRTALPEVELENISNTAEYVAPQNETQKELCSIICKILSVNTVGIQDDFFEIGGDSLKAIEFVSKAHSEGIYFTVQNVFDNSTIEKLCDYLQTKDKPEISFEKTDFTEINKILAKNTIENITVPKEISIGNVMIAGATGYLGIHILANYLEHEKGKVYCLVRGQDKESCRKRFLEILEFYFGKHYVEYIENRIIILWADLEKEKLGLEDNEYSNLMEDVNVVINAAASVKHYGSYEYFYKSNVLTTKNIIEFCKLSKAKFIHASTLSVSGYGFDNQAKDNQYFNGKLFNESCLYIGQPLDNVYARSKFEAEKLVFEAMLDGVEANIVRMGNLMNRRDGQFQKNYESNAFVKRLKGLIDLEMVPESLLKFSLEFTPIDEAADAVMAVAKHFNNQQIVFHINNTKEILFEKFLVYFNELGIDIKVVDKKIFVDTLNYKAIDQGKEYLLETFINDMDDNGNLIFESKVHTESKFTEKYLKQLGFEWSEIDLEYVKKYIKYFRKIGYLK